MIQTSLSLLRSLTGKKFYFRLSSAMKGILSGLIHDSIYTHMYTHSIMTCRQHVKIKDEAAHAHLDDVRGRIHRKIAPFGPLG